MTTQEFSNEFDTLLDSYKINNQYGEQENLFVIKLDEYEKSVILTQAQNLLIREYFIGFDVDSRKQIDFTNLITVYRNNTIIPGIGFDERSISYELPKDILSVLNEYIEVNGRRFIILPINYTEYDRLMSKPYNKPLKRIAWRIYRDEPYGVDFNNIAEVIPREPGQYTYVMRYVRKPRPIILTDLSSANLAIDEVSAITECELNPLIHRDILLRAVEMAYNLYGSKNNNNKQE